MNKKETILSILRKRRKCIRKAMRDNAPKLRSLRVKSRSIRINSPFSSRQNWYFDRLGELNLAINVISGEISVEKYVHFLLDDDAGKIACLIGEI